jgi:FAD/FMN-containing dehydrogenase
LVGKRTKESGDVSFVFTDSARESEARILGAGKGTGLGGGAVSVGVLLGTEASMEP